ncbi:MAG: molybdopterin cofactor-binding domain-containing protein, partial [Myxococcota bacterium]
ARGEPPEAPPDTGFALTAFIEVDAKGVTLITPRADSGQGIFSTLAYIIAEELDVDPLKARISPGMPSPIYYNAAVAEAIVPFAGYDDSPEAVATRKAVGENFRKTGLQVTGGSTSVPDMFDRLREAGAVARETFKRTAAELKDLPVDKLTTRDGQVILPNGEALSYGELASRASKVPLPEKVELRPPSRWRYIGKDVRRTDMLAKSTGTQTYGIDLEIDGMLHATVRTHPSWGGKLARFHGEKAEKMRGVKKVLPIEGGVAVVADNTWRAFRAMREIEVEWGPGTYAKSSEEIWKIIETADTNPAFLEGTLRNDGDVDAALASEDEVVRAEYRVPYLAHAPLEPINGVIRYANDRVDVWTGTQIPIFVQGLAAHTTKLPMEKVFVHNLAMGGSFGRRLEYEYVKQGLEVAMAMPGTPVKLTWTREEDMGHDFPRPAQLGKMRGRVSPGKVEALDIVTNGQSSVRDWLGRIAEAPAKPDPNQMAGAWDQPYGIPNYRVTGFSPEGLPPVTTHRAPGANANSFFHECFLDELLAAAGLDPLEGRLALCIDQPSKKVLQAVGELAGWRGPQIGEGRGRGIAFAHAHGVPVAEVVDVRVTHAGIKIEAVYVASDPGRVIDPVNFEAQVTGGVVWGIGHAMNSELPYDDY